MTGERTARASFDWQERRGQVAALVACLAVLGAITGLMAAGYLDLLALCVVGALAVVVAYRHPLVTIAALVFFGVLPLMLQMTPWVGVTNASIGRVPIEDVVLLPMAGAVVVRVAALLADRRRVPLPRLLPWVVSLGALLAVLLALGVAMGFAAPLSAMREFAVSYLGIVTVPYLALFLRSRRDIDRVFKWAALVGVVVPLVLLPLVGQLKGWGLGPLARFYPSAVHMGILYGLLAVYLIQARERSWRTLFVVALPVAVFLIIVDSHRSVWLAAGVALAVLTVAGRIRLDRFWKWGFVAVLVVAVCGAGLMAAGKDPLGYVATRSIAFTDPGADGTAVWRLAIWKTAIQQGRQHLILGEGFGTYYDFGTQIGTITVSPHSLYVQTFLKLGLVGLLTYLAVVAAIMVALASAWRLARRIGDVPMEPVLLLGLVAVCASVAYGLAYSFETYSMIFVGLGLAAALRLSGRADPPVSS